MSNSHSKMYRVDFPRLFALVIGLALISVALLPGRTPSSAAPAPSEKQHVRIKTRAAEARAKEYAHSSRMLSPALLATITVDRTDDVVSASACTAAANDCSLRGAVAFANGNPGTTISVPAGTYNLAISGAGEGFNGDNSIGDLDITGNNTSVSGAGAATTIIHQTSAGDRVVEVNPFLDANFTTSISGVTISGGSESTGVGGGGIISGSIDNALTLSNCVISGNSATGAGTLGGGGVSHMGGSLTITGCTISGNSTSTSGGGVGYTAGDPLIRLPSNGTLTVSGSTISGNTANSTAVGGGGADLFDFNGSISTYNISTSSFSGNSAAGGRGGAIIVESGPLTLTTSSLTGNSAAAFGGGIYSSGAVAVTFSRLVGNTVPTATNGLTIFTASASATANDNWWGVNTGPSANDFRNAAGPIAPLTWLQLRASASPGTLCSGGSSTINADIKQRNTGPALTVELNGLPAFPASFINATPALGSLSGVSANFVDGAASATFTASGTAGTANIDVTADNQIVTASVVVGAATTTSDPPDQTVCQGAMANFSTTAGGTGPFHYAWTLDGSPYNGDSSSISIDTTGLSVGNHTVAVTTTGSCGSASQSATLTVQATTTTTDPADQSVCEGATANFSTTAGGTGPFHYAWTVDGNPFNGDSSSISVNTTGFSQGAHTVSVTTTGSCGSASQSATLNVNNSPPVITVANSLISMWPPNHQYQNFTLSDFGVTASSSCDGDLTSSVVIVSVTSDELDDNPGGADGSTVDDMVIANDCKSVQLRRERDGSLDGRVYTVTFMVTDSVGHTATATARVTVPLNQNGGSAVDSGPHNTVNGTCP